MRLTFQISNLKFQIVCRVCSRLRLTPHRSQVSNFKSQIPTSEITPTDYKFHITNSLEPPTSLLRRAWWYFRQITGDAAYENYLRRHTHASHTPACRVLSREEFYLDALRRRYTGVSRCC